MKFISKKRIKHIFRILLFFPFIALLICKMMIPNNKAVFIFNYAPMTVLTASMDPLYKTDSFIIIKKEPINNLNIGDVIVYESSALNGGFACHRIIRITSEGLYTKGDNNATEDNQLITDQTYIGKCVFNTNLFARYYSIIKAPSGFILFFLLPLAAAILFIYILKKLLLLNRRDDYEKSL